MTAPDCTPMKRCTKCGNEYPATTVFFHKAANTKSGLQGACKVCTCERTRKWHENNLEYARERARRYATEHKNEACERARNWRIKHPEQASEASRQWAAKNADRKRKTNRNYRTANAERIRELKRIYRAAHKAERHEYNSRWVAQNYEQSLVNSRAAQQRRRARKRLAEGTHTAADIRAQMKRQKGYCYWCGEKVSDYHVDHVIPLSRGGSNGPENLVIACPACNVAKSNKFPHEWDGNRGRMF